VAILALGGTPGIQNGSVIPSDSIVLAQGDLLGHHRKPVTDRANNYLFTEHIIRFRGIYNPLVTSYIQLNQFAAPSGRAGVSGAITDAAVRHKIEQARKQVQLFIGGQAVVVSPSVGETTDAQWGPFVTANDVHYFGTKTVLCDVTVRCCINECYRFQATPPVILGHEYSMAHDIDQDFYTTRTIHGHAIFNAARLQALGARADDFRAFLFHPLVPGFHRQAVHAQVDETGGQLIYQITDRELTHSIGKWAADRGVTRIECTHSSSVGKPDLYEQASGLIDAAWDAVGSIGKKGIVKRAATLSSNLKRFVFGFKKGIEALGYFLHHARHVIPLNTQTVTVQVWGNRLTNRGALREVAKKVINDRLVFKRMELGRTNVEWFDDVTGKYVRGTATVTEPPFDFTESELENVEEVLRPFYPPPPADFHEGAGVEVERIRDVLDPGILDHVGPPGSGPWGHLVGDSNARGSYVQGLVASALLGPCANPPRPIATPVAVHREP